MMTAALLTLLATAPAEIAVQTPTPRAVPAHGVSVTASVLPQRALDEKFDRFAERRSPRLGLEASYDFADLGAGARLGAGAGVSWESIDGTLATGLLRGYEGFAVHAGLLLRLRTHARLQPSIALGGGATRGRVDVDSGLRYTHATAWAPFVRGSLGLRYLPAALTVVRDGRTLFGFAFGAEVGGMLARDLTLDIDPTPPANASGDTPLRTAPLSLGSLNPSAIHFGLNAAVVF
jgi:hypothetical protein